MSDPCEGYSGLPDVLSDVEEVDADVPEELLLDELLLDESSGPTTMIQIGRTGGGNPPPGTPGTPGSPGGSTTGGCGLGGGSSGTSTRGLSMMMSSTTSGCGKPVKGGKLTVGMRNPRPA